MEDEKKYIGYDVHREYSVIRVMDERGTLGPSMRVKHSGGELEPLLQSFPPGSPVAVETSGSAMWALGIVEAAGLEPHLAHALEVKKRIAGAFQTDESDAAGLAMLLRNGTLPEVWIASPNVRDLRGLVRSRLAIRRYQTAFKNRIHGVLNQYGLKNLVEEEEDIEVRDWFSVKAHAQLMRAIESLPSASREALRQEYILVRELELKIKSLETAIKARTGKLGWMRLLQTLPGVGPILGATIWLEIGDVRLSHGATSGGVCRAGAARAVQRRQNVARAGFEVVQSVFEMGFCGSRQYGGEVPEEMGRKTSACSETLPASEGDDEDFGQGESGCWPTSGGGQLVGSDAETGLP